MTECTISVCISRQAEIPPAAQCTGIGHYGNAGYGVSLSEIQNPIDFWFKVKCSKGFFDIFGMKWRAYKVIFRHYS